MLRHVTALVLVTLSLSVGVAQAKSNWSLGKWDPGIHNVQNAVFYTFCGNRYVYCSLGWQAWSVVGCETGGTYSVWAENGQYLGLFQMGRRERATYGHGWDPWTQAAAAKRYFNRSGWLPWQCVPGGGLRW